MNIRRYNGNGEPVYQKIISKTIMKSSIPLLCIGLLFTACAQQTKNETNMEFTDNVKEALADSGRIDLNSLHLQHRGIVVLEVIVRALPEVGMRSSGDEDGVALHLESARFPCPLKTA